MFKRISYLYVDGHRCGDPAMGIRAGIGWERRDSPDYEWDSRARRSKQNPSFIFQWTVEGTGELELLKARKRIRPVPVGHAFLIEIPGDHIYRLPPRRPPWEFAYINISGEVARPLWREAIHRLDSVAQFDSDSPPIEILRRMYQSRQNTNKRADWLIDPSESAATTLDFLIALVRHPRRAIDMNFIAGNKQPKQSKAPSPQSAVLRAVSFARNNYEKGIGVEALARAAHLSRHHFTRLFHEQMGIPPLEFLTQLRLRQASYLFMNRKLSMDEIAQAVGFADGKYLSKLFKRRTGMTPRQFRERSAVLPELGQRLV